MPFRPNLHKIINRNAHQILSLQMYRCATSIAQVPLLARHTCNRRWWRHDIRKMCARAASSLRYVTSPYNVLSPRICFLLLPASE
jgi:hypothetical protein